MEEWAINPVTYLWSPLSPTTVITFEQYFNVGWLFWKSYWDTGLPNTLKSPVPAAKYPYGVFLRKNGWSSDCTCLWLYRTMRLENLKSVGQRTQKCDRGKPRVAMTSDQTSLTNQKNIFRGTGGWLCIIIAWVDICMNLQKSFPKSAIDWKIPCNDSAETRFDSCNVSVNVLRNCALSFASCNSSWSLCVGDHVFF